MHDQHTAFPKQGAWYKGNLHAHSTLSDGEASPQALVDNYRRLGFDFLAITDHRVYGIHEALNRPDFLVLPGVELDVSGTDQTAYAHHVIGLGLPGQNTFQHGQPLLSPSGAGAQTLIDLLNQNGNVCIYAHPAWSAAHAESLLDLKGLLGMEVYNHGCEMGWGAGHAEAWLDRVLRHDQRLFGLAVDDTHQVPRDVGGGFVVVKATDLSHQAILAALLAGHFYASQGPSITSFTVEGDRAFVQCSPCQLVGFSTDKRTLKTTTDAAGQVTQAWVTLSGTEGYVRAICMDQAGRKAWTQPLWLTDAKGREQI